MYVESTCAISTTPPPRWKLHTNITMAAKKQSSREDEPMIRVLRQRELLDHMQHENEVMRLDLTRESRDARKSNSSSAAADIQRLQEEGNRYIRKIELERKKIADLDLEIADYQVTSTKPTFHFYSLIGSYKLR